jgi:hypothetical protein
MANTLNAKELLPDRTSLALCNMEKGAHGWVVEAVGLGGRRLPGGHETADLWTG